MVDLSRVLAGPMCSQILADHGADVIKVEPPVGDDTRTLGPPFNENGDAAYFSALNQSFSASGSVASTPRSGFISWRGATPLPAAEKDK
jgi:hypothetical protein